MLSDCNNKIAYVSQHALTIGVHRNIQPELVLWNTAKDLYV